MKNPPETGKGKGKHASAHAQARLANADTNGHEKEQGEEKDGDDALTKRIQAEAAALEPREDRDDDDDWAEDTSKEAVARRMKELESSLNAKLVLGEDSEEDDEEEEEGGSSKKKYKKFGEWLTSNRDASNKAIMDQMADLGVAKKPHRILPYLVANLFDDTIAKQLPARIALLGKLCVDSTKAQKALLGSLERFFGVDHRDVMGKLPLVLKVLFDEDVVEEQVFLKWGDSKASKKYTGSRDASKEVKEKAAPFLKWLREADDESEEESDDE